MQTSQFSFKRNISQLLLLVIAGFFLLIVSSCKNYSKVPTCVKLTKTQIQKWVKSGYTDPASKDYMISVRFKTAYAFPGTVFRAFVIGVRKDGTSINESLTELTPVDTCNKEHIKLTDFIFIGTNPANVSDLKILKDGKIIEGFQYLQLSPYDYTDPTTNFHFLAYNLSNITSGSISMLTTPQNSIGLPCPPCPNCSATSCPPPPTCTTCGPAPADSIKLQ